MRQVQDQLWVDTQAYGFRDITKDVQQRLTASGLRAGLCTAFIQHTSAGLVIQENADPTVREDLNAFMRRLAPEDGRYQHDDEGPDDMPAHIRAVLSKTAETIPFSSGRLGLGTWQALYVWEHRGSPHRRSILLHFSGE